MSGKHLIVDLKKCEVFNLNDMGSLYDLLKEMVKLVKMNLLTEPYLMRGAKHNPGITGFVVIEQSHISFHTFKKTKSVSFDLYSCKNFDEKKVLKKLQTFFKPKQVKTNLIRRK